MTESTPTTWNDDRDAAFFAITETLAVDGFADETALVATAVITLDGLATQIHTVLQDLLVSESWESMAMRSAARSKPQVRDLVPVPVAAPRRSAS